MARYLIKPLEDSVEVHYNGRLVVTTDSIDFANRWLRDRMHPGDTVKIEDPDGYLHRHRIRRRHWRSRV